MPLEITHAESPSWGESETPESGAFLVTWLCARLAEWLVVADPFEFLAPED